MFALVGDGDRDQAVPFPVPPLVPVPYSVINTRTVEFVLRLKEKVEFCDYSSMEFFLPVHSSCPINPLTRVSSNVKTNGHYRDFFEVTNYLSDLKVVWGVCPLKCQRH